MGDVVDFPKKPDESEGSQLVFDLSESVADDIHEYLDMLSEQGKSISFDEFIAMAIHEVAKTAGEGVSELEEFRKNHPNVDLSPMHPIIQKLKSAGLKGRS